MDQAKIEALLTQKQEDYKQVLGQLQQLDQAYHKQKDQLLTRGVETQGQIRLLQDLMPKPTEVVEVPKVD